MEMDKEQTAPHRAIESVTSNALPRQKPIRSDGRPRAFPTNSLTDAMPPSSKATQPRAAAAAAGKGTQEYHEGDEVGESLLDALMEETKEVATKLRDALPQREIDKYLNEKTPSEDEDDEPERKPMTGVCKHMPSKEMTGVDVVTTQIAATLSGQVYGATSSDSFALPEDKGVEIIRFDDNGKLKETTPPMALAVRGNTLFWVFCGTRGTNNPMDIIVDASFAPVTSRAWYHTAPNVRAQAGMLSLVQSYFAIHDEAIREVIAAHGIENFIFTGHSLGGGIAQLMHCFLQGEVEREGSDWNKLVGDDKLGERLTLRSLSFAAPMTIVNLTSKGLEDPDSSRFLERVAETSCCFVFEMDVVPRGYGCIHFINQVMHGAVPELVADLPVPKVLKWAFGAQRKLADAIESLVDGNKELVRVMTLYRHIGKICFYRSEHDPPEQLVDKGFYFKPAAAAVDGGAGRSKLPLFRSVEYEETSLESLTSMHNFLVGNGAGPGLAFPKPDQPNKI
mmetsp:Transcript_10013/g.24952  ORF Transcript_10013/g.24952 Transcript_10013/m.24952 type:complete len:507 (+) Transcript_10013:55-1575(+)